MKLINIFPTSSEHCQQDHPAAPDVGGRRRVARLGEDLGRDVGHRAAPPLQHALLALVPEDGGHAEVGDLEDVARLGEEEILGLDVAVGDAAVVQVLLEHGGETVTRG